ncbi:MAG: hypothetical protein SGI84_02450 [Gemmatimonadota bacterium]|nr:hypothetical protein [Gemmatimonadota bacterium]
MRRLRWPLALTAGLLLAQTFPIGVLSDPLGVPLDPAWRLDSPWLYTLGAPLFSLWDNVAMLSRSRLTGFLLGLAVAYLAWRLLERRVRRVRMRRIVLEEFRSLILALAGLALFVGVGMAWNTRPARRLIGLGGDELTVEIHSHTNVSHDVKSWPVSSFDAEASLQWHQRAGVDVLFVTDHNLTTGWERLGPTHDSGGVQACPGIEISAYGAHVVVLGTPLPADPAAYRGSIENRSRLFAEVAATPGAVAIASLPEYRGEAADFLSEGAGGFEIVNASPKANEFTRVERDSTVALARAHGATLVAAGDQHGYGATPMAWNVLLEPGWRRLGGALCATVVARFKAGGPEAVRMVERTRLRPDHWLPGFLTPLGVLWLAWATLPLAGAVSWLAWIWAIAVGSDMARRGLRERRARAILSAVGLPFSHPAGK